MLLWLASSKVSSLRVVSASTLRACNATEFNLIILIMRLLYYCVLESAACRSYSPNQWVPGKANRSLLDYFFVLSKPVLFLGALVGCRERVT